MDNPENVQKYPYYAWALAKQAESFCDYYQVGFDEVVETSDKALGRKENISVRELIKMVFDKMVKLNESGKLFIGLKKEDVLKWLEEDKHKFLKADNWMFEKTINPRMMFADLVNKKWYWDYYGDLHNPSHTLEFALLNVQNLEELNKDFRRLFLGGEIKDEKVVYFLEWSERANNYLKKEYYSNLLDDMLKKLFNEGSKLTKVGIKVLAFTTAPEFNFGSNYSNYWHSKFDEFRVEYGGSVLWTLGVPGYRIDVGFTDRNPDGQLGFVVSSEDLKLIKNLLYESKYTNAVHNYVTLNPVKPENVKEAAIQLSYMWELLRTFWKNPNL